MNIDACFSQWRRMCASADDHVRGFGEGQAMRDAAVELLRMLILAGIPASNGMYLDAVHVLQYQENRPLRVGAGDGEVVDAPV